jgi:hypothetical protein
MTMMVLVVVEAMVGILLDLIHFHHIFVWIDHYLF